MVINTMEFDMTLQMVNFVDELKDSFTELGRDVGNAVPRIIVALLILILGFWVAKFFRRVVTKILEKLGAQKLTEAAGIEPALQQAGTSGIRLVGQVVYFLILLIFLQLAAEALGIEQLTEMLNKLIGYLPLVVVALIVFFVTAAIANWAANVVRPFAESRNLSWVSTVVRVAVLVLGILAALDILNFAPSVTDKIQNTLLQYLPLSVLVAGTIAFGVGGIQTAKLWWAKLEPGREHRAGGPSTPTTEYDA